MRQLFETAPIEDEDSKKKSRGKRKKSNEPIPVSKPAVYREVYGYVATLESPCDRCGMPIIDLAEVMRNEWSVVCGWGCGRQWRIDPIPGVLDRREVEADFILRDGLFRGQTFTQVWASGNEWYLAELAKLGKKSIASRAAVQWLAKKVD